MSWGEVKKINSDMSTPLDITIGKKVDATPATPTNASTLFSWVKSIFSKINTTQTTVNTIASKNIVNYGTVVKSIQRGVATAGNSNGGALTIGIAAVDVAKCLVSLEGPVQIATDEANIFRPFYIAEFKSTQMTLRTLPHANLSPASIVSWQVVEFY